MHFIDMTLGCDRNSVRIRVRQPFRERKSQKGFLILSVARYNDERSRAQHQLNFWTIKRLTQCAEILVPNSETIIRCLENIPLTSS